MQRASQVAIRPVRSGHLRLRLPEWPGDCHVVAEFWKAYGAVACYKPWSELLWHNVSSRCSGCLPRTWHASRRFPASGTARCSHDRKQFIAAVDFAI